MPSDEKVSSVKIKPLFLQTTSWVAWAKKQSLAWILSHLKECILGSVKGALLHCYRNLLVDAICTGRTEELRKRKNSPSLCRNTSALNRFLRRHQDGSGQSQLILPHGNPATPQAPSPTGWDTSIHRECRYVTDMFRLVRISFNA